MIDLKEKIKSLVAADLEEIEVALKENLNPWLELTEKVAGHILFSGGKRLRPLLMVLSARLCSYSGSYDKKFSVIFEYLHAATLLHDDLVDEATLRRGKPVAHSIWGNETAVLTGDFLLARSLSLAAQTEKTEIIHVIAGITEDMSQGEIQQLHNKGRLGLTRDEYMDVIGKKTAVLMRGACRSGALISDADDARTDALTDYGQNIGLAFQMADDLLDYTSDAASLGKEPGADLKEGKLTLPVIYALQNADSADRSLMESIITDSDFTVEDFNTLRGMLEKYDGISHTREMAEIHVAGAKTALSIFEPSAARDTLMLLADYALVRKS